MTRVERQLRNELRAQERRIAALEAAQARPAKRKRAAAPRPDDAIVIERLKLWSKLQLLYLEIKHARLTKLKFTIKYHLGHPSDFSRFFSARGRRIPEGSGPSLRYYAAMKEARAELEALRAARPHQNHGIHVGTPSSSAQVQ